MRVAVVGVGSVGAQVLRALAGRPGVQVTGFERFTPGHDRGAGGGETRLFRSAVLVEPGWRATQRYAVGAWAKLQVDTGRRLLDPIGCVVVGPPDSRQLADALQAAEPGDPLEVFTTKEAARRFPGLTVDPGEIAVLDRASGRIRPEWTTLSSALLAERRGAVLRRGVRITELFPAADGTVEILSDAGSERFDRVVVTAGPWASTLLPELADRTTVLRPAAAWFTLRPGAPVFEHAFARSGPETFYGLPSPDGISVKVGLPSRHHVPAPDPDAVHRDVRPSELAGHADVLARWLPALQPEPVRLGSYLEGYAPDSRPVVGSPPDAPGVLVLANFSGIGFKMAPVLGDVGAALALGEKPPVDLSGVTVPPPPLTGRQAGPSSSGSPDRSLSSS